ncbi:MAG: YihY/virulence factor BrkB family protein, partial [Thermoleophilia bacterium]|nr:YihY/virulence factor BrkB family protein [Thermoleophilia bacterium]
MSDAGPGRRPDDFQELGGRRWWRALRGAVREFREDNVTDWSAALTYYAMLALFPALIVLVALVGLLGQHPQTTNAILDVISEVGPEGAADTFRDTVAGVVQDRGGAGALVGLGLLGALWSASGYVGAFTRAQNAIWETEEGRPFWKLKPLQLLITLVAVLMLAAMAAAIVVSGPLAEAVGDRIGLGEAAVTAWDIAKWPVILAFAVILVALLYYATPNVRQPRFRWLTPGAALAIVAWIAASALFGLYVAFFGSYNATYGSLAGVVVLLLWLWITNNALLLGAELDAEIERQRELAAGREEAAEGLQIPPRQPS